MNRSLFTPALLACVAWLSFGTASVRGIDIQNVLWGALDQPQINAYVATRANGPPLESYDDFFGYSTINVTAYLDTGASGILLSDITYNSFTHPTNSPTEAGLARSYYPTSSGTAVNYYDVGVGGSDKFGVTQPFYMALANNAATTDVDNLQTYSTVYTQKIGPVRAQIGAAPADPNDILAAFSEFDVIGMPAMQGKVAVFDPKPVDDFASTGSTDALFSASMQSYIYNPRTPFNAALADSEPGIPATNRHIRLSYGKFDRFSQVTPTGATGPTLNDNPFIGPDPVAKMDGLTTDHTPGVTVSYNGLKSTGSFLFDTGAAVSMISTSAAANLHVRYVPGTKGTDSPVLETFDPANPTATGTVIPDQFVTEVGGVGGSTTAAGFYLDNMLLRTMEGLPGNDNDPNNLNFVGAPVFVADITVKDPITSKTLTLDGVFGVNNWVGTTDSLDLTGNLSPSNFNWAVFDQPNGVLGLDVKPELVGSGVTAFSAWYGSGTSNVNWSNSANWESGTPAAGNGLRFTQSAGSSTANFNDFPDGTRFNGILFSGPSSFNLQGHRVALWGNLVNISTATQTVSLDLELNGAARIFDADSGDIMVSGKISGSQGLIKTGDYALTLSGTNTYTGGTTVSSGALVVTSRFALPDGGNLTIGDASAFASITGSWATATSGAWSNSNNWTSQLRPNGAGQTAVFNVAASSSIAITLDASQTVGALAFGNSASSTKGYILTGSGASTKLTLNNNGGGATITVSDGQHAINAPIVLADNLTVTSDSNSDWTLTFGTAGGIAELGHTSLTLDAPHGKLILSGTDSFSGGTFVAAGTLIVTRAAAIADRSNLSIGNASLFAHAAAVPSQSPAAVPEPGALALLAASAALMLNGKRFYIPRRK